MAPEAELTEAISIDEAARKRGEGEEEKREDRTIENVGQPIGMGPTAAWAAKRFTPEPGRGTPGVGEGAQERGEDARRDEWRGSLED